MMDLGSVRRQMSDLEHSLDARHAISVLLSSFACRHWLAVRAASESLEDQYPGEAYEHR